jgi:hypothetical protein
MTEQPAVDPFLPQEQEFRDKVAAMHPNPNLVVKATEAVASAALDVVDDVAVISLDTAEDVKAEFVILEARFKAAASRLEDMVTNGVTIPAFAEAKRLFGHVVAIAKSL